MKTKTKCFTFGFLMALAQSLNHAATAQLPRRTSEVTVARTPPVLFARSNDDSRFVVSDDHGTMITSVDGITWRHGLSLYSNDLRLARCGNLMVKVSSSAGIQTSLDGV